MQGLSFLVVCALAALCLADSNNDTYTYTFPTNLDAQVQAIYAQKVSSENYASLIMNFQSTMGWMQVSQGWLSMLQQEQTAAKSAFSLEEDDEEMVPLMFSAPPSTGSADPIAHYDETERAAERALLSVLKIMYVQAGHKLARAQESHYQTKAYLATLQAMNVPQLGSVVSMMYYLEVLRVMSSAFTIQRQDAWNTWLVHEIIETDVFGNVDENIPAPFKAIMAKHQVGAMTAYFHEASTDLQIAYLEMYLNQMVAQLFGGHFNANAAHSSFLEEESTAEPSKPFFPFMGMGMGMNPQVMSYYTTMMRFWSVMFNYQAAQGLLHSAQLEEKELTTGESEKLNAQVKQYAVYNLQQWAYLNMMQLMYQFQGFGTAHAAAAHANAANANAFVQTEAPETPATPAAEFTEEQKAVVESVVNQFLRPQPIFTQNESH